MKLSTKQIAGVYLIYFNLTESETPEGDKRYQNAINELLSLNGNYIPVEDIMFDTDDQIHGASDEVNKAYAEVIEDICGEGMSGDMIWEFLNDGDPTTEKLYNAIRKYIPDHDLKGPCIEDEKEEIYILIDPDGEIIEEGNKEDLKEYLWNLFIIGDQKHCEDWSLIPKEEYDD